MKRYFLILLIPTLFTLACAPKVKLVVKEKESTEKDATEQVEMTKEVAIIPTTAPMPKMTFEKRLVHLGKIKKGDQIPISYTFTNTGDADLEIDLISVCDCTTVKERPYLPIKPGEKGRIDVVFDSNQKDESETIEIDIWLKHIDPVLDMPVLERLQYDFEFE